MPMRRWIFQLGTMIPTLRNQSDHVIGHLDSLECPNCRHKAVSVWFSHPASDTYRTWFICSEGYCRGKLLSPERRRCAVEHARAEYEVSERRACRVVRQWRGTQRYLPLRRTDEDQLTQAILALAAKYGRYGYRRITALVQSAGWAVGKDRVQRIWRREGLKEPQKQRARGRLWLGDGSCVRLRPERANHVWSYDFVKAITHDGRALRILVVIDEYTRECLALRVARRLGSLQVIETLADVMLLRGIPEHIRSDNGPEFIAKELRKWLGKVGTKTL
jgi:putative transposase